MTAWKRTIGKDTENRAAASFLDGIERLKERDARMAKDVRTEIQKLLGEPETWRLKPKIRRAPRERKLTPEDAHAAMIFAQAINRLLFGDQRPPNPRPRRRQ